MNQQSSAPIDEKLLHATVKLNSLLFAAVCALMSGTGLLLLTYLSLQRGLPDPGHYLNLLGVFLPGYRVSTGGAWIGFFWGGVIGAVSGLVIYRIYARGIRQQVQDFLTSGKLECELEYCFLKLNGHALGLALGGLAALGLLVTTNWLVLRGTADESTHAALLGHYLPGYTVSTTGSLIGAVEILLIVYVLCAVLAAIYNRVHALRMKGASS